MKKIPVLWKHRVCGCHRHEPTPWRGWVRCVYPLVSLAALAWFLFRVIPKPSRAMYPCQQAAFPLASSLVVWLLGLHRGVCAWLRAAGSSVRVRRALAVAGVVGLAAGLVGAGMIARNMALSPGPVTAAVVAPNAPIGIARGIHPGRVVWYRDAAACSWSGSKDGTHWWDSNKVSQARVEGMLSAALRGLTGATNDTAAWDALFRSHNQRRGYGSLTYAASPRKGIAIKINQNPCNYSNTDYYAYNGVQATAGDEYSITGNPHLILALVRQLVAFQVAETNILVYDASGLNRGWGGPRTIGDNIYQYIHPLHPGVRFLDGVGKQGRELAAWPASTVTNVFYPLNATGETTSRGLRICQQILDAGFVINLAIMKSHGDGPTLCAKNHYGSISGQRHGVMYGSSTPAYYSNLVPLMGHPELGEKTMLFLIDALYGASSPNTYPTKWKMRPFQTNWPNSVFVSQDGVAIDCVGFDFLNAEWGLPQNTDYHLLEAASIPGTNGVKLSGVAYRPVPATNVYVGSLGTAEHWNDSTNKLYSRNLGTGSGIELLRMDASAGFSAAVVQPPSGSSFTQGVAIALRAQIDGATNPIAGVTFFQGTHALGVAPADPYLLAWSNAPVGTWSLTAVAADTAGLSITSSPVSVTVVPSNFVGEVLWDADPATAGPQDGGGVWSPASSNWWTGSTNVRWDAVVATSVVFGAGSGAAGTVTLGDAGITAENLAFRAPSGGTYTLAGGGFTLALAGTPAITVDAGCGPVISAPLSGAAFTKLGGGLLSLTSSNAFAGTVSVNEGTLALSGDNRGSSAGCSVAAGAVLRLAHTNAVKGVLTMLSGATVQLRADDDAVFAPAGITLANTSNTLQFHAAPVGGVATGKTLRLAGALAFGSSSDQSVRIDGSNGYALALGAISATAASHNPYYRVNVNVAPGLNAELASFTAGNWGTILNLAGGGGVTVTGNLANTSNGSAILFVNDGTRATLRGRSVKTGAGDAYRYFVPNGTLVLDHSGALTNNTTGAGLNASLFVLGAATNIAGSGYSAPAGFLVATNNGHSCAVFLGDAAFPNGGLRLDATVTNHVSDGDVGFTNFGTMVIGGQNTRGTNTYANPIVLGWTPNRGKGVTLLAAPGGQVDFTGSLLRNGNDSTAGVTVGGDAFTGTIRLAGINTYEGPTRVVAGRLLVAGSTASGSVVTVSGGTLGGTGTLHGPVNVQDGGTLAPGDSVGTLTVSNDLFLAAAATFACEIGAGHDRVVVSGNLTLDGTIDVHDAGGFGQGSYPLFTYAGTLTDQGMSVGAVPDERLMYRIDTHSTGSVVLIVEPITDPFMLWQVENFGSLRNPLAAAGLDPDGDGCSNRHEFLAGTDPRNDASCLTVCDCQSGGAGLGFVLQWPSSTGKTYAITFATNLQEGFTGALTNALPATPPVNVFTTPPWASPRGFYRVELNPDP